MNMWITIVAALLSGLAGSLITMAVNNKKEKEREKTAYKRHVFQSMIAFRGDVTEKGISTGQFIIAANQVFVAFNDSEHVIKAFERYRQNTTADNLVTLFKEMAKDLGINYSFANDDLFSMPLVDRQMLRQ